MFNKCYKCQTTDFKKLTEGLVFGAVIKYKNLLPIEFWQVESTHLKFLKGVGLQICDKCIKKKRLNEFWGALIMVAGAGVLIFLGSEYRKEWLEGIGWIIGVGCLSAIPILWKKDDFYADSVAKNFTIDLLPEDIRNKEWDKIYTRYDLQDLSEEEFERLKQQEPTENKTKKNKKISRKDFLGFK